MIKLGEGTFVSYILGKRIKIIAVDKLVAKLYINDEYKGKCDLSFILEKIHGLENKEQDIKGIIRDEQKMYDELREIIQNQNISSHYE
ncbi:hypothetical protein IQ283_01585 [Alkalihalobacillus hwajinpoensis]|uniref:hypothetical protein n=1 Tax=Guptibacillus hwajinpoensis TaxID=208199 RepID=UPI0018848486|nr:hypothetical protein [Pseudalkalibacillus hwajinpoensis]MBF0705280.1 hypothetical protein [Pseudalkalibacillus hwajinpoensis]